MNARRLLLAIGVVIFPALWDQSAHANPPPEEYQKHQREPRARHGGGVGDAGIGLGIGVGIGVLNEVIRQSRERDEAEPPPPKKKRPASAPPKKKQPPKAKAPVKKESAKPAPKAPPPEKDKDTALAAPPFPDLDPAKDCEDCDELWRSILAYHEILIEDTRKLAARKQELADRQEELERARQKAKRAAAEWDRTYFTRIAVIAEGSIKDLEEGIAELEKLVEQEWTILRERVAQYEECVDRHCPKPIPVAEVPMPAPAPAPLPVVDAPPEPAPPPVAEVPAEAPPEPASAPPAEEMPAPVTPVSAPPEPAPMSTPPREERKICGPNVTQLVLDILRKMKEDFEYHDAFQEEACRSLLDPKSAGSAWDIAVFSPSGVPVGGSEYDPASEQWIETLAQDQIADGRIPRRSDGWVFTKLSKMCAVPRPVCGHTVELFGTCQHAQVVNYVQWGMMMNLCGGAYPLLGSAAHRFWNKFQYSNSAPAAAQKMMIELGDQFADALEENESDPDLAELVETFRGTDMGLTRADKQCEVRCELTAEQKKTLADAPRHFHWRGLGYDAHLRSGLDDIPDNARKLKDAVMGR